MTGSIFLDIIVLLAIAAAVRLAWVHARFPLEWRERWAFYDYMSAASASGLDPADAFSQMRMRRSLAILRRRLSEAVLADVSKAREERERIVEEVAGDLAVVSSFEARHFRKWVAGLGWDDVLYPKAAALYWTTIQAAPAVASNQDHLDTIAALKQSGRH